MISDLYTRTRWEKELASARSPTQTYWLGVQYTRGTELLFPDESRCLPFQRRLQCLPGLNVEVGSFSLSFYSLSFYADKDHNMHQELSYYSLTKAGLPHSSYTHTETATRETREKLARESAERRSSKPYPGRLGIQRIRFPTTAVSPWQPHHGDRPSRWAFAGVMSRIVREVSISRLKHRLSCKKQYSGTPSIRTPMWR